MNIGIIGGGASGLICAIILSKANNKVTIIEKNSTLGKKILMTGNGRCNYFNQNMSLDKYYSHDKNLLENIINQENINEVLSFFDNIGIVPNIKNGYYYPASNTATAILNSLLIEIKNNNVTTILDTVVTDIKKRQDSFTVITNNKNYNFDKVIIAIGSNAGTKEENNLATIIQNFNLPIINPKPALVPLILEGNFFRKWSGIRANATVSIYNKNNLLKSDTGEVQLTDYGASGICVMNLSSLVANYNVNDLTMHFNFLPNLKKEEVAKFLEERNAKLKNRTIIELLESIVPYKLLYILISLSKISNECHFKSLTTEELERLIKNLCDLTIPIVATKELHKAQVVTGGIKLSALNEHLEAKNTSGLYFMGEAIDVDGVCGGYNLGFAWLSGLVVANSIIKNQK